MGTYKVSGKAIVEVYYTIEAESKEDALKKMNEKLLCFDDLEYEEVYSDEPIEWNYAEEFDKFYGKDNKI